MGDRIIGKPTALHRHGFIELFAIQLLHIVFDASHEVRHLFVGAIVEKAAKVLIVDASNQVRFDRPQPVFAKTGK